MFENISNLTYIHTQLGKLTTLNASNALRAPMPRIREYLYCHATVDILDEEHCDSVVERLLDDNTVRRPLETLACSTSNEPDRSSFLWTMCSLQQTTPTSAGH